MQVLDHEPNRWFLLQDGEALLLDTNCSHGPVSYSFLMALDAKETARFRAEGRGFLNDLSESVHMSNPGARGSPSSYRVRRQPADRDAAVAAAVLAWRAAGNG